MEIRIKFNYQTGEVISSTEAKDQEKTGLFDYLKEKNIRNRQMLQHTEVSQEITTKYEASKRITNKVRRNISRRGNGKTKHC